MQPTLADEVAYQVSAIDFGSYILLPQLTAACGVTSRGLGLLSVKTALRNVSRGTPTWRVVSAAKKFKTVEAAAFSETQKAQLAAEMLPIHLQQMPVAARTVFARPLTHGGGDCVLIFCFHGFGNGARTFRNTHKTLWDTIVEKYKATLIFLSAPYCPDLKSNSWYNVERDSRTLTENLTWAEGLVQEERRARPGVPCMVIGSSQGGRFASYLALRQGLPAIVLESNLPRDPDFPGSDALWRAEGHELHTFALASETDKHIDYEALVYASQSFHGVELRSENNFEHGKIPESLRRAFMIDALSKLLEPVSPTAHSCKRQRLI